VALFWRRTRRFAIRNAANSHPRRAFEIDADRPQGATTMNQAQRASEWGAIWRQAESGARSMASISPLWAADLFLETIGRFRDQPAPENDTELEARRWQATGISSLIQCISSAMLLRVNNAEFIEACRMFCRRPLPRNGGEQSVLQMECMTFR
jgi:hypothetical protein